LRSRRSRDRVASACTWTAPGCGKRARHTRRARTPTSVRCSTPSTFRSTRASARSRARLSRVRRASSSRRADGASAWAARSFISILTWRLPPCSSLAVALSAVDGVRVLPLPPQVSMFHLHFDADADVLDRARIALAQRDSVWIGGRFAPSPAPRTASLEVNVGDSLGDIGDSRVAGHFEALIALARSLA
jgi:hypothetical protein